MGIETKNTPLGKFISKGIQPGNVKATVRDIFFKREEYAKERPEYMLYINLETEPIGGSFVGFDRVFGDPSSGKSLGQLGKVRASAFNFYDGTTKNGYDVSIQNDVLGFLRDLCQETGCIEFWNSINGKYETIAMIVDAINKAKPFKDVFINCCIGARIYKNKNGYDAYDLSFVRGGGGFKSFSADVNKVVKYNPELHLRKQKPKELPEGFEANNTASNNGPNKMPTANQTVTNDKKGILQPNTSFTSEVSADIQSQRQKLDEKMPEGTGITINNDELPFELP